MLLFLVVLMLIVGYCLVRYAYSLEEKANQQSCYDTRYVKGAVRGVEGMFVSESMLDYKRNKVNGKKSKF